MGKMTPLTLPSFGNWIDPPSIAPPAGRPRPTYSPLTPTTKEARLLQTLASLPIELRRPLVDLALTCLILKLTRDIYSSLTLERHRRLA